MTFRVYRDEQYMFRASQHWLVTSREPRGPGKIGGKPKGTVLVTTGTGRQIGNLARSEDRDGSVKSAV
jgi:hypothetical protein